MEEQVQRGSVARPRPAGARRDNVSDVLRAIIRHGPLPRVDIASLTALSGASVTRITAELMDNGVVRQMTGTSLGRQGAPRVPLDVHAENFVALGVHIGQRRANIGLVDLRGHLLERREHRYRGTSPSSILDGTTRYANELVKHVPASTTFLGTGLSIGGQVDANSGVVVENTGLSWSNVPLRDLARADLPGPLITVDSTYRGLAHAELSFATTCRSQDFLVLFVGNLIGAAIVTDGRIRNGAHSAAGNVAHLPITKRGTACVDCGRRNCFLAVAGDQAVIHRAADMGLLSHNATDQELIDFLASTDETTHRRLLKPRAQAIGEVVASLVEIIDPQNIVLADPLYEQPAYQKALLTEATINRPGFNPDQLLHMTPNSVITAAIGVLDAFYDDPLTVLSGWSSS